MVIDGRRIAPVAIAASVGAGYAIVFAASSTAAHFASAVVVLALVLLALHLAAKRVLDDALNLLSLTMAFYAVAFVSGGVYSWFALRTGPTGFPAQALTSAVELAVAAAASLAAGYFADPLRFTRTVVPPPLSIGGQSNRGVLLTVLLVAGWSARLVVASNGGYYHIKPHALAQTGSSWFLFVGSLLPLVAVGFVGAHALGGGRENAARTWRWGFRVLVLAELAWTLPTGSREQVIDLLIVLVVVRYYAAGRLPSLRLVGALMLVVVFVLFPLVGTYRADDFRSSPAGALLTASSTVGDRSWSSTLQAGGDTLARFADVTAVARIFQSGRGRMEFSTRETLVYSLEGFVPRAIYPDKKSPSDFGNEFGRSYGFLSPLNRSTSIATTVPGELYLGGGIVAVLLGMAVLGSVLRLLDEYLRARKTDAGALAIYGVIAASMVIGCETSIAIGFIGTLKAAAVLAIVVGGVAHMRPRSAGVMFSLDRTPVR